jgi:iron-sulfur cluster assembly accessory protein
MTLEMTLVTLTDAAIDKVRELIEDEGDTALALRLEAMPAGCSGYKYEMYFDGEVADTDSVIDAGSFKVLIGEASVDHVRGATIDFKDEGLQGSGFAIDNPNTTGHSCTCGKRD